MDSTAPGTVRVRLDIAYDGTDFRGWSMQPNLRTVQGEIESHLATIFRRWGPEPKLTVAGRTDAGVHASGQVAHFDLTKEQVEGFSRTGPSSTLDSIATRINGIAGLEADFKVLESKRAPDGFDARFSAIWRSYKYRIADSVAKWDPMFWRATLAYPRELALEPMQNASDKLLGLHDWSAFCKSREESTNIRTLFEFDWSRDNQGVLIARLRADAFCHSMVRSLVGALVAVGEGKLSNAELLQIRKSGIRGSRFKVLPAKGLTLTEVGYPPDSELADRATATRAKRQLDETGL
ncbi:MAG: tRNA pseudouridine(38-40) synthase TruA [Microbacteriaceae bacterium]|nr:tRNA pseudouridine(38-40) synthase TruA [Cryobacterium sp.]MCC6376740.1 tRNA pseudouridine(38-40) synthase TruA [Microbacteriaceae bacterium]